MATPMDQVTVTPSGQTLPFNLTDLDREVLAQTDEEFEPHDWEDLKAIVRELAVTAYSHR